MSAQGQMTGKMTYSPNCTLPEASIHSIPTLTGSRSAINLILAFAVALKHRLRFEPYAHYEDIDPLTSHLDTFARAAWGPEIELVEKKAWWKEAGEYLGLPFAEDNPRRAIKRASRPLGNLPLEILNYLSAYADEQSVRQTLKSPIVYGQICKLTPSPHMKNFNFSTDRYISLLSFIPVRAGDAPLALRGPLPWRPSLAPS
jgi:hypothetical protein